MERPHARDVRERETSDEGFSAGWGQHFQPSERYWIDAHTHMRETTAADAQDVMDAWNDHLEAWRLRRTVGLDGRRDRADAFAEVADTDDRFRWLIRLDYDDPDPAFVAECLDAGASGIKLHNKPVIQDAVGADVWEDEAWHEILDQLGEADRPVLWHVTQRFTDSPYTGGARDSYWAEGWANGAEFTNEDLLQGFLDVVEAHPETDFIGAHQLHLGFDRLHELFRTYPNLHIDTSIGGFVRWGDQLYPEDKAAAREFFMEWSDRILFGTDCILTAEAIGEYLYQHFLGHVRYVRQLDLPHDALQDVSHRTAERVYGIDPVEVSRKGALRP